MGAVGAADPRGVAGWTTSEDRHARGDERHFYLLRTGCPWRYLPRDSFPPRSTVYNIFRKFQRDGVWEAIWVELRERMGREASPSAVVLDGQSVKSAVKGR
jgi:transposase